MFDFNAIGANNGWAMSLVGALTVFTGLVILTLVVSQMHRLLQLLDNGVLLLKRWIGENGTTTGAGRRGPVLSREARTAVGQFGLLVQKVGQPFSLPRLIEHSQHAGLKRPHALVNEMLEAGLIIPDAKGYFLWRPGGTGEESGEG